MNDSKNSKDMERAQSAFHKKEAQQREGVKAMADYRAAEEAQRTRMAKLRALRLAKEEADAKADAEKPAAAPKLAAKAAPKAAKPAKPAKAKAKKRT